MAVATVKLLLFTCGVRLACAWESQLHGCKAACSAALCPLVMGGTMSEDSHVSVPARYRAFISYSHADTRFAGWLHRKLEAWSLPGQARLTPIFIDRAELAAGPDLSAQVRDALAASSALIVVASPAARASRWVAQEVSLFRELHPDRPVLAALLEGEPLAAFPDPLLSHGGDALEPLAADFREGHDGKRLALLKIVAGLTAQPLDRLVQRDAQSRQRRVMAVTAGALLLSLILAAALIAALRARTEAEHQRAEAEGMVEFMLTELRDKLKGVGRLDVMGSVNEQAFGYYAQRDLAALPDASLDRRARLLHAMGEDDEKLGQFAAAQSKYNEALRITSAVLARHPAEPDAIFAQGQSEYWVGEAAWQRADLPTARRHWLAYRGQAEALSKAEPDTKRSLMELGYASGNLCEWTQRAEENPEVALPHCEAATGYMRRARAAAPHDTGVALALANRLGWQADVLNAARKFDRAITLRREEAALITDLLRGDPQNLEFRERRQWPQVGIAKALLAANRADEALTILRPCLAEYEELQRRRSDNINITEQRMRVTWMLARAARLAGSAEAERYRSQALMLHAELRKTHTPAQMARFNTMIEQLTQGGRHE